MEQIDNQIILAEKSLANIRGYLWNKSNSNKTWSYKFSNFQRRFLGR